MNRTSLPNSKQTHASGTPSHVLSSTNGRGHLKTTTPASAGTTTPLDFSLHDKAKLLRLAERIQTKNSTPRNTQVTPYQKSSTITTTPLNTNTHKSQLNQLQKLASPNNKVQTHVDSATKTPTTSNANFGSKARSKLYASFSSKKSRLIKSDPAKTNIEHLVVKNRVNGNVSEKNPISLSLHSDSPASLTSVEEFAVVPDTSFHNHSKLVNAFSPDPSLIHMLTKRSHSNNSNNNGNNTPAVVGTQNGKYYQMQNEISPEASSQDRNLASHLKENERRNSEGHELPSPASASSSSSKLSTKPRLENEPTATSTYHFGQHQQHHVKNVTNHQNSSVQVEQPKISSAQIISLSRKASLLTSPSQLSVPSIAAEAAAVGDDENNSTNYLDFRRKRDSPPPQPQSYHQNHHHYENHNQQQPGLTPAAGAAATVVADVADGSSTWLNEKQSSTSGKIKSSKMRMRKMMTKADYDSSSSSSPSSRNYSIASSSSSNHEILSPPPPIPTRKSSSSSNNTAAANATTKSLLKLESETEDIRKRSISNNHSLGEIGLAAAGSSYSNNVMNVSHHSHEFRKIPTEIFPPPPPIPRRASNSSSSSSNNRNYYHNNHNQNVNIMQTNNNNCCASTLDVTNTMNNSCHFNVNSTNEFMKPNNNCNNHADADDGWSSRGVVKCFDDEMMVVSSNDNSGRCNKSFDGDGRLSDMNRSRFNDNDNGDDVVVDKNRDCDEELIEICGTSGNVNGDAAAAEEGEDFDRKKTRSLPKSFMKKTGFLKNGLLPSLWTPADESTDQSNLIGSPNDIRITPRTSNNPYSMVPDDTREQHVQQQLQHQQYHHLLQSKTKGRPKSLDYSQRNGWMKVYSNMELASINNNTTADMPSPKLKNSSLESDGVNSIPLQADDDVRYWRIGQDQQNGNSSTTPPMYDDENDADAGFCQYPDERYSKLLLNRDSSNYIRTSSSSGIGSHSSRNNSLTEQQAKELQRGQANNISTVTSPNANGSNGSQSLFQRFSKTFSLRFGSNSNNIENQNNSSKKKLKPRNRVLGSSPDLVSKIEPISSHNNIGKRNSVDPSKFRKGSQKSLREDKCQSGDSGIQESYDESQSQRARAHSNPHYLHHATSLDSEHQQLRNPRNANSNRTSHLRNSMNRLSLVEFPNQQSHSQSQQYSSKSRPNRQISLASTNTVSYEDLLEAKLDDDGFISNGEDEINNNSQGQLLEENGDDDGLSLTEDNHHPGLQKSPDNSYYHSLPAKYLRQKRTNESVEASGQNENAGPRISVRGNIIKELLTTEQNYVKLLTDIIQGYLLPARQNTKLFSSRTIHCIFSNLEELLKLHEQFLKDLQDSIEHPHHGSDESDNVSSSPSHPTTAGINYSDSLVGHVFIVWSDQFHHLYSDYCVQNTLSIATLRQLTSISTEHVEFFELCRRRQLMDKLPLHGFLLRPIQRICQYHLQLSELVKHTPKNHNDYEAVVEALDRMKMVAARVNETQRVFDMLQELARTQITIEGFEGPDLLDRNTAVLHRGDLVQMNQGSKHKEVYVIILNQEVLICRKDSAKRGTLVLTTRIDLNSSVWLNIDSNEEDDYFGMVHNSWRIYNPYTCSWILFTAPSPNDKKKWTAALDQTVYQDKYRISPRMREIAKLTATILLTDSLLPTSPTANNFTPGNPHTSTLPKLKKNGNRKSLSSKIGGGGSNADSGSRTDLMLIEVGKLKKNHGSHTGSHQNCNGNVGNNPLSPVRTSKFYV